MKPVLGSEKAKIWQEQALRASDEWKELGKARAASPLGRGLPQGEPGRRPPVAGFRGSWRPEAAPKNTARRVCATRWRVV